MVTLSVRRGDSKDFKFCRKNSDGSVIEIEADAITFSVKKKTKDMDTVISKKLSDMTFDQNGYYHVKLLPEDTEIQVGEYVFDIEVRMGADYVKTPIFGEFEILEDVTRPFNR